VINDWWIVVISGIQTVSSPVLQLRPHCELDVSNFRFRLPSLSLDFVRKVRDICLVRFSRSAASSAYMCAP